MNLLDKAEKLAIAAAAVKQQVNQATAKGTMELSAAVESAKQVGESTQEQLSTAAGQAILGWQSEIAAFGTSSMAVANALGTVNQLLSHSKNRLVSGTVLKIHAVRQSFMSHSLKDLPPRLRHWPKRCQSSPVGCKPQAPG